MILNPTIHFIHFTHIFLSFYFNTEYYYYFIKHLNDHDDDDDDDDERQHYFHKKGCLFNELLKNFKYTDNVKMCENEK